MKNIKRLCWSVHLKMSSHFCHPPLHFQVPKVWNTFQNRLDLWNSVGWNLQRKLTPIKHITEGQNIVIRNYNRDTPSMNCFHQSWARYFITTWAQAKLALSHEFAVILVLRKVFEDSDIIVFVLPMCEQDVPDVSMRPSGKEAKDCTLSSGQADVARRVELERF